MNQETEKEKLKEALSEIRKSLKEKGIEVPDSDEGLGFLITMCKPKNLRNRNDSTDDSNQGYNE